MTAPGGAHLWRPRDAEEFQTYWVDAAKRVHVVGKGVTRFHAVYWPAMLMSAGLPMPTEVVVHGYITASGQKLSIQVQPLEVGAPLDLPARIRTPRLANPQQADDFRKQVLEMSSLS